MTTAKEQAARRLRDMYYEFLLGLRKDIHFEIEDHRLAALEEDTVVRPMIQARIETVGSAIEDARESKSPQYVIDVLIQQVQMFNRMRHTNRIAVKEIAAEQSVKKAMHAEVSREISRIETEYQDEADLKEEAEFCAVCEALAASRRSGQLSDTR